MSSADATEPPTKMQHRISDDTQERVETHDSMYQGKVVLKTTLGELEVELWPIEAPKAVRNFISFGWFPFVSIGLRSLVTFTVSRVFGAVPCTYDCGRYGVKTATTACFIDWDTI
ncbi:hypothetical protein BC830DRAFT_1136748 [Chytriomyces sp. MP71]|nr:hypothetical protein BC830DRAFT_1136748 [Chytriomyces sp. MP71]